MDIQVWIADFGSQYTQLITRRVRELGFSSQILTIKQIKEKWPTSRPHALILSGGPYSIYDDLEDYSFLFDSPTPIPILGICYGMQLIGKHFGGKVVRGTVGEYGHQQVLYKNESFVTWMSHADHLEIIPPHFSLMMKSESGLIAAILHETKPIMGLQFHPEVEHTEKGREILTYFLKEVAHLEEDWDQKVLFDEAKSKMEAIGDDYVLCAFSGGVDSLVAATLGHLVIGKRLYCFFVDTGLLRPQDYGHIADLQKNTNLQIEVLSCAEEFLAKLKGIADPEEKRKIIGKTFIEVFDRKVHEFERDRQIRFHYLLQGTLYPDVIESISPHEKDGKSVTIKSHHNVGGLPAQMNLKLLEPLKFLFKDEVRTLGLNHLNLPEQWIFRHPFPGPGIGIRIMGEVKIDSVSKVQLSDQILWEELKNFKIYDTVWQAFTVLLPVKTVGVKGDARVYEEVICVRIVNSSDGMTAHWSHVPYPFLNKVSSRITNEVSGITRVVYDITAKPPGTIEWE